MNVLFFVMIGSLFSALANFFIRKNMDTNACVKGHFLASFGCSFLISLLSYQELLATPVSWPLLGIGAVAGAMIVLMMRLTAATLTKCPAGIAFAFQTSGSVFPGLLLFLLFGEEFGFMMTPWMVMGWLLVLIGIFWASKDHDGNMAAYKKHWMWFAVAICVLHTLLLAIMQWRTLFFGDFPEHALIPFAADPAQDKWFMPGMFGAAFLLQGVYMLQKGELPSWREVGYGSLGGLAIGVSTSFLLFAITIASPIAKGVLFPLFSVGIIMLCNLWSCFLYKEKVRWKAHLIASAGIFLATC